MQQIPVTKGQGYLLQDVVEIELKDSVPIKKHWHCTKCWKEDYMFIGWTKVCKNCYDNDAEYRQMLLCTPLICSASS